jgi:hypothetical protein
MYERTTKVRALVMVRGNVATRHWERVEGQWG